MKLEFVFMDYYYRPDYYTIILSGKYCKGCTHNSPVSGYLNTCNREGTKQYKPYPICLNPKAGTSFWKKLK